MKRIFAFALAAALCICLTACGEKSPDPQPGPAFPLLTLYADKQPLRVVTQREGVRVTLQLLEYEPTLDFLRPIADEWEETLEPGKEYEIGKELAEGIPQYRLFIQQGENMALHNLVYDGKDGREVFEIEGRPWAPAPVDENSPMIHLCRTASFAPGYETYDYWYAIANAIATLRGVDNEWPPDEEETSEYRVPEWLFEAYAAALFPGVDVPFLAEGESEWVSYHPETHERYWVGPAWSTWIWTKYKDAKQNPDGTWDVTITVGTTDDDEAGESVVKLAPNEAYNPDSPFEYHLVGLPMEPDRTYGMPEGEDWDGIDGGSDAPNPAAPPPEIVVGTWKGSVGEDTAAYLEIFADGMAGLYAGDPVSDQLYEIYRGAVCPADDTDMEGSGVDYLLDMEFNLDWYIYESEDGSPVTGVPDTYKGTYTLRQEWEGGQQVLFVKASEDADPLFGKKEVKMEWVPKTLGSGGMADAEAVG